MEEGARHMMFLRGRANKILMRRNDIMEDKML